MTSSLFSAAFASLGTPAGTPNTLIDIAVYIGAAMLLIAMALTIARLVMGPTLPDRILALDTLAINGIALLVLFSIYAGHAHNFEVALLIAMTGFIGTVALCKYLLRGDIIE